MAKAVGMSKMGKFQMQTQRSKQAVSRLRRQLALLLGGISAIGISSSAIAQSVAPVDVEAPPAAAPPVILQTPQNTPQTIVDPAPTPTPSGAPRPIPPLPKPVNEPPPNPDAFPPNPLELRAPDPLLPTGVPGRPLTAAEQQRLAADLEQLNVQATAQHKAGDRLGAIETWNRELRLRRFLGPIAEVQALGRVGDIAWQDNQTSEVRWITKRLDEILAQLVPPPVPGNTATIPPSQPLNPIGSLSQGERTQLLEGLGQAYQQVRQPKSAVIAYEQVLAEARQRRDGLKVEATLITLGQVHLSWFDYTNAARVYQELLAGARASGNQPNQVAYLTQLAYTYEQAKQPEPAIAAEKDLIALYQTLKRPEPIPALKIRVAENYERLGELGQAEINYQDAFKLAQPLFQFGYASDALQKLGVLYRANDRLDAALNVYDFLLGIEQQAYNYYGMMAAYDQLGQIYISRREFPQAVTAFQKGLDLARQLKYREDYFAAQIRQLREQAPQ